VNALKHRFRLLKSGIRVSSTDQVDNIFLTCCALHNWVQESKEKNQQWSHGIAVQRNAPHVQPDIITRLVHPIARCENDVLGNPRINFLQPNAAHREADVIGEIRLMQETRVIEGETHVKNMTLNEFRSKLVQHFNILFQQNEIKWPKC